MFESYKINTWLVVFTTILKNITPYFALLGSKGAADATLLPSSLSALPGLCRVKGPNVSRLCCLTSKLLKHMCIKSLDGCLRKTEAVTHCPMPNCNTVWLGHLFGDCQFLLFHVGSPKQQKRLHTLTPRKLGLIWGTVLPAKPSLLMQPWPIISRCCLKIQKQLQTTDHHQLSPTF